jgi:DNA-binding CsgD family transcriptional regulator
MLSMARFAVDARRAMFERAARMRRRVEDGELGGPLELTVAAMEVAMAGDSAAQAADLAERAAAALKGDPILSVVVGFAVHNLIVADRFEDADRILTETIDEARRMQANYRVGPLLVFRSEARFRAGALAEAAADAEAARTSYAHAGRLPVLGSAAELVQALTEQGRYEEAEAALANAGADGPVDAIGEAYTGTMVLNARARLRLAQGDARAALADLVAVGRRQAAMREPNPATLDWRSRTALAYAALDRRPAALALAREELELARRFGAPRAIGIALRTVGAIADDLDRLEEAVEVLGNSPARLEHAYALADLGVALRHRRRVVEAREPLRQALDLAVGCGAEPLAERARTELAIAGARPRREQLSGVEALTANERRVAAMAAGGRSNREIAQALYVSHKTVEKHLTAAYRKLGVEGRDDLATALDAAHDPDGRAPR